MKRSTYLVVALACAVMALAGCAQAASSHPAARASVHALATNPAVVQAKNKLRLQIGACSRQVQSAQAAQHPVTSFRRVVSCTVTLTGSGTDAVACSRAILQAPGATGTGSLARDETAFTRCMTGKVVR
jgi:hypothetical protein